MLEKNIERIANAMERIATRFEGQKIIAPVAAPVVEEKISEPVPEKPAKKAKKVIEPEVVAPVKEEAFEEVEEEKSVIDVSEIKKQKAPEQELTVEHAREAVKALAEAKGVDAARAILGKYKATKISDLSKKDIAALVAEAIKETK